MCGLVYIVTAAEDPTDLDELVAVTECDIQPGDASRLGPPIIDVTLIRKGDSL